MQKLAIVFFSVAGILSAILLPNTMSLIPLLVLSISRAAALAIALLLWVASGKLDSWGFSRPLLSLGIIIGGAMLTGGCLMIQMTRDDNVPAPMPLVYRIAAGLLPVCFMAAVLLASRSGFLIVSALAPIAGVLVVSTWKPLNAIYIANLPQSKEQKIRDQILANKIAQLDAIPDTAGVEPLLEFVDPEELYEIVRKAQDRIEQRPEWISTLAGMLGNREKRLRALYVLTRRMDRLPEPTVEQCWQAANRIAQDPPVQFKDSAAPPRMLLDSVTELGTRSDADRRLHWKELVAVRDILRNQKAQTNTSQLDFWVRKNEFDRIPESAGISPLLEFAGPEEAHEIRRTALARIAQIPDSTEKLVKLLEGVHQLDALVVLGERVDELSPEVRQKCWRTTVVLAKDMSDGIDNGRRPKPYDVRKLSGSASMFWPKLGSDSSSRLTELAVIRNLVRAAADEYQKAAFAWADQVLAGTE